MTGPARTPRERTGRRRVQERGGYAARQEAVRAVHSVLDVLGAHLLGDDRTDLARLLPRQCAPLLIDGTPASGSLDALGLRRRCGGTRGDRRGGGSPCCYRGACHPCAGGRRRPAGAVFRRSCRRGMPDCSAVWIRREPPRPCAALRLRATEGVQTGTVAPGGTEDVMPASDARSLAGASRSAGRSGVPGCPRSARGGRGLPSPASSRGTPGARPPSP